MFYFHGSLRPAEGADTEAFQETVVETVPQGDVFPYIHVYPSKKTEF